MPTSKAIADAFDVFNNARLQSVCLEDIWREAYNDEYAEDAKPNAFYPLFVLDRIIAGTEEMNLAGEMLLDVGCGHGMTGLFLAKRLGSRLSGIDVSSDSIKLAQRNALDSGILAEFCIRPRETKEGSVNINGVVAMAVRGLMQSKIHYFCVNPSSPSKNVP